MSRTLLIAVVAMAAAPAFLHAQSAGASAASAVGGLELTLFAGAGRTLSLSQPDLDRAAGPIFVGGIELARPAHPGLLGRLALRAEGGFASQDFNVDQKVVGGDVQTVHAALALRLALIGQGARASRLVPYALAGAAWGRSSTRFVLNQDPQSTPGAGFEQVTHENVPGAIVGAGIGWHTQRVAVRAEARWMALATTDGTSSTLPVLVTIAVPLYR